MHLANTNKEYPVTHAQIMGLRPAPPGIPRHEYPKRKKYIMYQNHLSNFDSLMLLMSTFYINTKIVFFTK